ncbi:hypothetical protein [Pseudarthrobacter albicanus]|uniref:hypothetical protein n=1 Tax=Pseudarthrobacter albicanus TaxID=2823873 RepID=UPI001BADBAC3|nr:hypothetical protein [Pseudarthrobacter albicanus]
MDPVTILERPAGSHGLHEFHRTALVELEARRQIDYEVADLFVCDPLSGAVRRATPPSRRS